jgi:hypothetical protein
MIRVHLRAGIATPMWIQESGYGALNCCERFTDGVRDGLGMKREAEGGATQ